MDENNPNHYRDIQNFVNDVRLIFKNSMLYHKVSGSGGGGLVMSLLLIPSQSLQEMKLVSKIIDDGRSLEQFFDQLMAKWLPGYSTKESEEDERHKFPLKRAKQSLELD